ncbi:DEAD/DEAH box helicase [Paenibacillus sp. IB182496]|uniref:DEAD/DEAH box helicase n=2 Tax=Paenibacillus sabuli TaxID=2772509 RepID=A0A927BU79_9BACL|nr:DEAD/DEAH box helicase [Paenibacillus sabuli]
MGKARACGLLVLGGAVPAASSSQGAVSGASDSLGSGRGASITDALVFESSDLNRMSEARASHGVAAFGAASGAVASVAAEAAADAPLQRWGLSPAQRAATVAALAFMLERQALALSSGAAPVLSAPSPAFLAARDRASRDFLLWAVTGAGKTEMIFPLIEAALRRGGRALVATPRRDVVLELDPRIRKAFPEARVTTLYGGSPQRWERGQITLATTHQLLRFAGAFELVIVDELDAFPYHGDPMLHAAADRVCTPGGTRILLSATPPPSLQREVRKGRLAHARVPVRYHRHPLPEPAVLAVPAVRALCKERRLPRRLTTALRESLERGAQIFVFVQRIRDVGPLVALLRAAGLQAAMAGTSSKDEARTETVQAFRQRAVRLLVTTTILERGVTVPRSDVFILDADGPLFDASSLVQMAGRAGRAADDPHGRVYFCSPARSRAQHAAIRQIREMNKLAKRRGYLIADDAPQRRKK